MADEITAAVSPAATIGILGLAFKPNSDDVRESPAKDIISMLLAKGYTNVVAYDPLAMSAFQSAYGLPITYAGSLESCIENSSVLVLLTAWNSFIESQDLIKQKSVLDYRYVL